MFDNQVIPLEVDLCDLLRGMKLAEHTENKQVANDIGDALMVEDPNYLSDGTSECSSVIGSTVTNEELCGCAYLLAIQSQLANLPTTGGEYLDIIFTHREVFATFPEAHPHCSRSFSDMAYALEQRAWRADREADTEAVAAFRHEAWMIAASLRDVSSKQILSSTRNDSGTQSALCVMQPML